MAVFRLLVRRFPDAVPAGELGGALGIKPSTLSVYLSALFSAGLVDKTRAGTSLRYRVRMESAREIMDYLFLDCCRGRPQICPPSGLVQRQRNVANRKQNVIFICTGNSARSILAESILRNLAPDRFNAYSAGTRPAGAVNPFAIELLRRRGHDTGLLRSKNLDEFLQDSAPEMDFVFTVCDRAANEECPLWPGQPVSGHWGIPDPAAVAGSEAEKRAAFAQAYARMTARIRAFITLQACGADMATLQSHIDNIGQMPLETQE